MAKISTKTGDDGLSSLFGGGRYPKTDIIYSLLGDIDELNSSIGIAKERFIKRDIFYKETLENIQQDLIDLGSYIGSLHTEKPFEFKKEKLDIVEKILEEVEAKLPPLSVFIHPGGKNGGAEIHHARTVCRKVERSYWNFLSIHTEIDKLPGKYLNRLSDYFFQLARLVSMD